MIAMTLHVCMTFHSMPACRDMLGIRAFLLTPVHSLQDQYAFRTRLAHPTYALAYTL